MFPQVKIRLIFWDADEDFSAQTQILVDSRITDYVHLETTGCIVSDLLEMLEIQGGEILYERGCKAWLLQRKGDPQVC